MRFRKFLKPYKTRGSSFREHTYWKGGIVMFKTFRKNTDKFITKIKRKIISGAHCI